MVNSSLTVWGYITDPSDCPPTRNSQYFILNGRTIRSKTLTAALEEGYRNTIPTGRFPGCVIHCAIDPAFVDVNVHPSKLEVRFSNERDAFSAVYIAVCETLTSRKPLEESSVSEEKTQYIEPEEITSEPITLEQAAKLDTRSRTDLDTELREEKSEEKAEYIRDEPKQYKPITYSDLPEPEQNRYTVRSPEPVYRVETREPELNIRVAGELYNTYIIAELPDEIVYIDKHAAHERIIFNRLQESEYPDAPQVLISPIIIPLPSEDMAVFHERQETIAAAGLSAEPFGEDSVIVREIPSCVDIEDIPELLLELSSPMFTGSTTMRDSILHSIACKAAIKAGRSSDIKELEDLARVVLTKENLRNCPHGRPIVLSVPRREFERSFRR